MMTILILIAVVLIAWGYHVHRAVHAQSKHEQLRTANSRRRKPAGLAVAILASAYAVYAGYQVIAHGREALFNSRLNEGGLVICILCVLADIFETMQESRAECEVPKDAGCSS